MSLDGGAVRRRLSFVDNSVPRNIIGADVLEYILGEEKEKMRLDVLFVIPTNVLDIAQGNVKDAIEPPAKARFVAAYLMRRDVSVGLFDANVLDLAPDQMAQEVRHTNPHLVVIPVYGYNPSASTQTMPSARALGEAIKQELPETHVMMMGTHLAAIPETTLNTEPAVDSVCGGEGPITVHELLQALKNGGGIENVRSLWYRNDGGIMHTNPAPLIDLNEEPALPGWSLMDPRKYRPHHWQTFYSGGDPGPYANPYSREGCPFHCDFCNIQAPYREGEQHLVKLGKQKQGVNSFRDVRPELFLEEVTFLVEKYGVHYFKIPDEMFGLGEHPLKIARLICDRFKDSLNFWCYYRVDTCKPEHLDLLRSAGFRWIGLGIEAANSKVRSGQDKRFGDEHIHQVVKRVSGAGIEGGLNYIFGLPGDTIESMQATYDLACELNGPYGNFYCAQALPGSRLYQEAKESGYPLPERPGGPGWIGYAQYSFDSEPYHAGDALTPAQILKFRDEKHVAYYKRPEWRQMILKKSHFGEAALATIDEWLANIGPGKLKRRLLEEEEAAA